MLIHPLGLEQFNQGISEKLILPCLGWLEGFYETNEGTMRQLLSLYFRFYKVTMFESTNATDERRM